jgi:hypothetical protein
MASRSRAKKGGRATAKKTPTSASTTQEETPLQTGTCRPGASSNSSARQAQPTKRKKQAITIEEVSDEVDDRSDEVDDSLVVEDEEDKDQELGNVVAILECQELTPSTARLTKK